MTEKPKRKSLISRIFKIIVFTILGFHMVFLTFFLICSLLLIWFEPPVTGIMLYRTYSTNDQKRMQFYKPIEQLPDKLPNMVLAVEDAKFWEHHGVDIEAIEEAWEKNKGFKKRRFGGSTITQQLARTIFLWPEKSFLRKYLELLIALEMDMLLSKSRILELYLNYAEWGKGAYGAAAGAQFHYHRDISKLSDDELARLVVLLSSPRKYSPANLESRRILSKRYRVLTLGLQKGFF